VRKSLSDKGVAALKARPRRYSYADPQLTGHYVRVQPSGAKAFVTVAREPAGKQVWTTLGATDLMTIDDARELARETIKRVRAGLPAIEAKGETFGAVAENWIRRHVEPKGLRSRPEIERLLARHILPTWKDREFTSIRRSDVAALLDHVEDKHGARQADYCLNITRALMNWFATRNDDYGPPIVRGMRRQSPAEQARARILSDGELLAIWKQAEANGIFGAIVRLLVLTAQRREKVITLRWGDVSDAGEWTIPRESREKDSARSLLLPEAALAIIRGRPRMGENPYVFAGRADGPVNGFSKWKAQFDAACGITGWRLHDLRRTARSLMSRAGVRPDVAERVMGHAIAGVEGIYDRHSYKAEKADALRRLAALINSITNPREDVIVGMTKHSRKRR
jgi:integrase